jgi:hypothetical protein
LNRQVLKNKQTENQSNSADEVVTRACKLELIGAGAFVGARKLELTGAGAFVKISATMTACSLKAPKTLAI